MAGAGLPDVETREEVLARLTAEHGPSVAAVILRDWGRNTKGIKPRGYKRRDPRANRTTGSGNEPSHTGGHRR